MGKKKKSRGWPDGHTISGIPDADLGRRLFRIMTGERVGDDNFAGVICSECECRVLEFAESPALEDLGDLVRNGPK